MDVTILIKNINIIIQQFLPGYIAIRIYYKIQRPRFNLEYKQIMDSIFLSFVFNSVINISQTDNTLVFSLILSISLSLLFCCNFKWIKNTKHWLQEKFQKDFSYDVLKKYSEPNGCYIQVDLYDEKIKIQGVLEYYDDDDAKENKYMALSKYEIYNYDADMIESFQKEIDVIIIDQKKIPYFKVLKP